ncbi:MAG TPA: MobF family relaxase [Solirubrobacterales bacterium]|jgi:conjugative relaxase-like TrwC/TraI family protein|nr:MobF family relaxase [Solirubrobacterales bacterium]
MLSIGKLGAGQERYYTERVAEGAEDYYSGRGEAEGYWLGSAAVDLGLDGKVDPEGLTAMLTGRHPASGEPLGLRHVAGRGPVPGFDLTFSAPKSVSLTWALGGDGAGAEVAAAQRASVAAALDYMQRQASWTRRGHGGHEFVRGNGFLAAAYLHRSSRAGDPQLHTHVLVANATRGPDGRWTRLYHPAIYDHAKTAGYIYEANLRWELTRRLGVRWQEVTNGIAEIEGFDPDHLRAFSTRRAEILAATAPDASARARQVAAFDTRRAKDRDIGEESLRERWRAKAEEIGLDRETIRRTFDPGREVAPSRVAGSTLADSLTSHASHFDRRDAVQAVADQLPAGAPAAEVEEIADAFLALDSVIAVGETAKGRRFTTERIWEIERDALAAAREMAASGDHGVVDEVSVARVLAARSTIKPDQRVMVERLTTSGEQLVVVVGEAGTGKTFATVAAAEAWADAGLGLRVAAPTWRAANVLRSEGLDPTSVARLLVELDKGRRPLPRGSVLLVDEAGMVDSATLARLIDHARAADAKLVLVGDPAQLGEIEAGGLFGSIVSRTEPVVLDQVIRHNHDLDRDGARRIREGRGAEAVEVYRSAERVVVCEDHEARREEMVRDWWRSFSEGEDALMVAKRNAEVARLNALAREVMRSEGRLGEVEIEVGEARFAVGDQVITRVNDHRAQIYNRERWRVAATDAGGVELHGVDTDRRVTIGAEYLDRENPSDGAPALQHAYAATTYQAQGSTVDRAYVMADPSMDRQELYVAASRSRDETFFYATPEVDLEREEFAPHSAGRGGLAHIAAAAERDGAQVSAHDQVLRSRLDRLSSPELVRLRDELRSEAGAEREAERRREQSVERATRREELLAGLDAERLALGAEPRRRRDRQAYREALRWIETRERQIARQSERNEAAFGELPAVTHDARAEVAAIHRILDRREDMALAAARVSPGAYLVAELGERPDGGRERIAWDRAARDIEGYRQRHGLLDRDTAIGPEAKDRATRREQVAVERSIATARRESGLEQLRDTGRTMEIGVEL